MFNGKSCLSAQKKDMHLTLLKKMSFLSFCFYSFEPFMGVTEKKIHSWNSFWVLFLWHAKEKMRTESNVRYTKPESLFTVQDAISVYLYLYIRYSMTFLLQGFEATTNLYWNENMKRNWINIKPKTEYRWSIFASFLSVLFETQWFKEKYYRLNKNVLY